jgi:hypothetical protein
VAAAGISLVAALEWNGGTRSSSLAAVVQAGWAIVLRHRWRADALAGCTSLVRLPGAVCLCHGDGGAAALGLAAAAFSLEVVGQVATVEVYKWIVLALSISSDFWLRWLVHEG